MTPKYLTAQFFGRCSCRCQQMRGGGRWRRGVRASWQGVTLELVQWDCSARRAFVCLAIESGTGRSQCGTLFPCNHAAGVRIRCVLATVLQQLRRSIGNNHPATQSDSQTVTQSSSHPTTGATTTASRWHFVSVRTLGARLVWEAACCGASVNYYCGSMWLPGTQ